MWAASIRFNEPRLRFVRPHWNKYIKKSWDELRDAKSATERINNGSSNRSIEAGRIGNDFDHVLAGKTAAEKLENEMRQKAGLPIEGESDEQ